MKYFTPAIWAGWQSDNEAVVRRVNRQWAHNLAQYKEEVKKLAPRLGARNGFFFTQHSLHDANLLRLTIKDWSASNLRGRGRASNQTFVEIDVLPCEKNSAVFHLSYSGIEDISIQTKNDLFSMAGSKFGDWGYDELRPAGKNLFRHTILFQTGSEISIVFRKFSFTRTSASKAAETRKTRTANAPKTLAGHHRQVRPQI